MAKRYIETGFYKSPYVRGLKGPLKALYSFIICDCDSAGIWVKDLMIASAYIGFEVTEEDFQVFVKSGRAWDLQNGKYFFPDFIEHQYPNGLSEQNPANKKTINELKKYKLVDKDLKVLRGPSRRDSGVPPQGTIVTVSVTEEVKVDEEVKGEKTIYRKFAHLYLTHQDLEKLLREGWTQSQIDNILDAIENYKGNKKYNSLLYTARNWLRKEHKVKPVSKIQNTLQAHEIAAKNMGL